MQSKLVEFVVSEFLKFEEKEHEETEVVLHKRREEALESFERVCNC